MLTIIKRKLIIVSNINIVNRYTNDSCLDAANIYRNLERKIGCTYLIYMHENLITNEKSVYSSNWDWQDILIGERLINNCPIFLAAFKYLEPRETGHIFVPWYAAPPSNKEERNVCGMRSEFNIANGLGYAAKGHGIRESLAFGGDAKDSSFYKNFIVTPNLFTETLKQMRLGVLLKNHYNKKISDLINTKQ